MEIEILESLWHLKHFYLTAPILYIYTYKYIHMYVYISMYKFTFVYFIYTYLCLYFKNLYIKYQL